MSGSHLRADIAPFVVHLLVGCAAPGRSSVHRARRPVRTAGHSRGGVVSSARSPRFVFITDVPPARETSGRFAWLLFAANNRPLARSAAAVPSLRECRSAAHRVRRAAPTDELAMTQSVRAGRWLWAAALDEAEAVCVHAYLRRVECSRAAALFRRAVEDADPDSADVRCFGPRTLRAFDAPVLEG